ncbi:MAG: acetate kinase [Bacteroidales bacterium]|nr:acetate kinase [Bacteroidales bacterium]
MKILVINSGSSSIKYQFFDMTSNQVIAKGLVDKIGLKGSQIKHTRQDNQVVIFKGDILDHQSGIEFVLGILKSQKHGCIKDLHEIDAVGHRVVHGAEHFNSSVLITEDVIEAMKQCIDLAPLHNPPNLKGIYAMQALLPEVKQVGVFDTAFHQSMPDYAYMYAIPYTFYKNFGVRRYGFHGTSHRYVSKRACEILGVDYKTQKIISCHLGNGASIAAIQNGKSIDTSMGMTPVEGLIMGTRSGDLDIGVYNFIMDKEEINRNTAYTLVNKHSGMLGITGISSDMRELELAAEKGQNNAQLALNMYDYRIKKYIGSYTAAMNGIDILVFTGGVGENADLTRRGVAGNLSYLGIELDNNINTGLRGKEMVISTKNSKVKVIVVPTDEEYVIAKDTLDIITKGKIEE